MLSATAAAPGAGEEFASSYIEACFENSLLKVYCCSMGRITGFENNSDKIGAEVKTEIIVRNRIERVMSHASSNAF